MEDFDKNLPGGFYGSVDFMGIIIVAVLLNVCLIVYCMKKRKRESEDEIQSQVQLQVEKYFKL